MRGNLKFALILAAVYGLFLGLIAGLAGVVWSNLKPEEQELVRPLLAARIDLIVLLAVFGLPFFGMALRAVYSAYAGTALRIAEETQAIQGANPNHRLAPEGPAELRAVVQAINTFADGYRSMKQDVEARVGEAKAGLEEEKNRLAALMSELTQAVLVCNLEGRILLYNNRARQMLNPAQEGGVGGASLVGLGRSIFGIIERDLITHALETLHDRLLQPNSSLGASFVTSTKAGQLIRVQMAPVLSGVREEAAPEDATPISGFVLTLENITRTVEQGSKRDVLLQSLTEGSRASLANIRAAVETMLAYPDMEPARQGQFIQVIGEEASALSARLDKTVNDFADSLKTQWPLEDMRGTDLISAAQRRIEARVGLPTKTENVDPTLWLKVDSYSLLLAITYLASRLKDEFSIREVRFRLEPAGRLAHLDLIWTGAVIGTETLPTWETQPLNMGGEASPLTLKDVVERHGGEVWYQYHRPSHAAYFRLLIPVTQPEETPFTVHATHDSRPEYYDFDLFHQPGQNPELDQRLLSELAYTVFDTETTGLDPSAGDEIISIGAVRIVNGRLLQQENFDQLVDPRRSLSSESVKIHGIKPAMLEGQPTIELVLPAFHRFCEDTVLVAHNAAFDMRFLQMKEERTGIKFAQPVLDTLLLSAVLYSREEMHKLEAIAAHLGINVIGRHTALGDAIVTGEVFLKMVPLLAERGIRTLKDAREASRKTFYARIEY